jgi:hypothetical protein
MSNPFTDEILQKHDDSPYWKNEHSTDKDTRSTVINKLKEYISYLRIRKDAVERQHGFPIHDKTVKVITSKHPKNGEHIHLAFFKGKWYPTMNDMTRAAPGFVDHNSNVKRNAWINNPKLCMMGKRC